MKIIYNIPNIIRMAGMERILAIKANYLAGLTGMEVVIITYEQKNLPLAFDFSDKILKRFFLFFVIVHKKPSVCLPGRPKTLRFRFSTPRYQYYSTCPAQMTYRTK